MQASSPNTHTHISTRYPSDTRTFARFTSLLCLRATFSRTDSRVHHSCLPPFSTSLSLSPRYFPSSSWKRRELAPREHDRFPPPPVSLCLLPSLYRRPKENPFDDSSLANSTTPPIPEISVIFRVTAAQGGGRSEEVN